MKLYSENKEYKLYQGSMLDMLDVIEPNSIDAIITDPPYGLTSITKRFGKEGSAPAQFGKDGSFQRLSRGFMGKEWDGSGIEYNVEAWRKCFEVLKPGGHLLAFGGSRTFYRIACAIEDAGFEIRDTIMWLYGSGFPKSLNIGLAIDKKNGVDNRTGNIKTDGKATNSGSGCYNCNNGKDNSMKQEYEERKAQNEWSGWGTQLKPSYEPIIVARKPVENSIIDNVMKYGVGGINIDECRVPAKQGEYDIRHYTKEDCFQNLKPKESKFQVEPQPDGRFPANVILTYDDTDFEEVCGGMPDTKSTYNESGNHEKNIHRENQDVLSYGYKQRIDSGFNDEGSVARYFYCAKASKFDRDEGLDEFKEMNVNDGRKKSVDNAFQRGETPRKNIHPTVKPVDLMRYLVRLVSPKGATILDCFNGSGSTGKAVMLENKQYKKDYKYIGIELTEEYLPISKARIEYICNNEFDFYKDENEQEKREVVDKSVTTIFNLLF